MHTMHGIHSSTFKRRFILKTCSTELTQKFSRQVSAVGYSQNESTDNEKVDGRSEGLCIAGNDFQNDHSDIGGATTESIGTASDQ